MKNFQLKLIGFLFAAFLLSACSQEENNALEANQPEELVNLSLNISLMDLNRSQITKQENEEYPDCIVAAPYYVEICIMQDDVEVVGKMDEPFRIDLAPDQMFTQNVPEMELPAGSYTLEHCAVYAEDGTILCLAPRIDSPMALFSDAPMPMAMTLLAGTKPFPDVPVFCFDNRDVNEFGYLFFDIEPTIVRNFCFFANYCSDSGRHYPARYSLDISIDGTPLYSDVISNTGQYDADGYFADPVCVDLPIIFDYDEDEEYIDYTLTLLPWDDVYEEDEELVISGSLSRMDIEEHLVGDNNIEYEHIFFNCDNGDEDIPLPDFGEATFSNPTNITNPYYGPMQQYIYHYEGYEYEDGEFPDEPTEVIFIERKIETREVMGIQTVIQRDYVSEDGVIIEDTDDWLAQDDDGNLWYMGEDSKNYDDEGNYIDNEGSWEAGVDGALPGYWLPGDPYVGQRYYQEFYEGEAEDWAEVIAIDASVDLEIGSYSNVLVTRDVNPFEPGVYELKYYAPGTGFIKEEKYEDDELVEEVYLVGIIVID